MANNNTVKKKKVKMSTGDKVFTVINTVIMILVCIAIVYPLYYVLLASVTDPVVVSSGKILLYPEAWYTNGYETTLKYQPLWTGYANTIKYTVLGTLISLVCTIPAGYALSRYDMVGRKPIMFLFTFTMFFSGGMIPMYLTVQQLHIYNTTWAMVLPVAIIAVMCLFYATAMWNQFFNALMFLQDDSKMPLQVVLRNLVLMNQSNQMGSSASEMVTKQKLAEQLKYCVVVVSAFPLLCVYPFLQKYFAKGVTIGAVKG